MSEHCCGIRVGEVVPDFKIDTFEPAKGDFGEVSLGALKAAGKWTVLFFIQRISPLSERPNLLLWQSSTGV